jgi:disulfide bond formation protein DsbB
MMFSINIYLRFALIALCIIGGLSLAFVKGFGFWYAFPLILVGLILLVGYILLGTVQSAAMMLQTGNMVGAEQRLGMTYFPQWLFKPNRAYFFLLKGTIAGNEKEYEKAEEFYVQAQNIGLPSDNEKAMVFLSLANFRAMKNNWQAAENFFRQVKGLKVTEPMLKEQIVQFETALKQKGQANIMMRQGFRGYTPGGKRPRPKMK